MNDAIAERLGNETVSNQEVFMSAAKNLYTWAVQQGEKDIYVKWLGEKIIVGTVAVIDNLDKNDGLEIGNGVKPAKPYNRKVSVFARSDLSGLSRIEYLCQGDEIVYIVCGSVTKEGNNDFQENLHIIDAASSNPIIYHGPAQTATDGRPSVSVTGEYDNLVAPYPSRRGVRLSYKNFQVKFWQCDPGEAKLATKRLAKYIKDLRGLNFEGAADDGENALCVTNLGYRAQAKVLRREVTGTKYPL